MGWRARTHLMGLAMQQRMRRSGVSGIVVGLLLVAGGGVSLREFPERVEHLGPGSLEVSIVPRGNRQSVSSRRGRDVAVLNGHALARLFEESLLLDPDVRDRDVEPMNATVQCVDQPGQPRL